MLLLLHESLNSRLTSTSVFPITPPPPRSQAELWREAAKEAGNESPFVKNLLALTSKMAKVRCALHFAMDADFDCRATEEGTPAIICQRCGQVRWRAGRQNTHPAAQQEA